MNTTSVSANGDLPPKLWQLARLSLPVVLVVGLLITLTLAFGIANPPAAGPRTWEIATSATAIIPPRQTSLLAKTIEFQAPFTLEAIALLSRENDPDASWGIVFQNNDRFPTFGVLVNGNSFFSITPSQPDFTPFVHIRPPGESNKLTFTVETDNRATLRISDEVAWQGIVPSLHGAIIRAYGGAGKDAKVTLQRLALYLSQK